jgi:asparagine synthase (glutamine-hydrolysing)
MCGICGIVNFNATEPANPRIIERMARAQAHRGPDDEGFFVEKNVALGHRRLSIIDLSGGSQPLFNEDGSKVVVFNGEIYNYAELTTNLIAKGHGFRTRSDTEAIVHSYEEFGDDCVLGFRGMFAFAVWDRSNQRLLLARDRLGVKPLYYYTDGKVLLFASEIKALLAHPTTPREIDRQALDLYLALRYVPGPRTMFKNIFKLQPGHLMTADRNGIRIRKYWDINHRELQLPESEWLQRFESLLEESVRMRLVADVPLGVFLSGGLDSSTMVAMMSRITNYQRVKTFAVGYDVSGPFSRAAESSNEFTFARTAAGHFGADHHELRVTAADFTSAIPQMVEHLDEPLADPSCIPLYFISKAAREHITVVLSGEGADETLGGYALYRKILGFERNRRKMGRFIQYLTPASELPLGDRMRGYIRRATLPLFDHYRGIVKGISPEVRLQLTGVDRLLRTEELLRETFRPYFRHVETAGPLEQMLYADAKVWLPENLLLKADKMTMAAAIELRVPFLDHKLVEFAATIPEDMKIRGKEGKWILRRAMAGVLPASVIRRRKQGFPSPTESWLRLPQLRDYVHDTVLAPGSACREYFHDRAVESVVHRHWVGDSNGYQELWSLVVFEQWRCHFMHGAASHAHAEPVAPQLQV